VIVACCVQICWLIIIVIIIIIIIAIVFRHRDSIKCIFTIQRRASEDSIEASSSLQAISQSPPNLWRTSPSTQI
ncbi:hypothetical protein ALC53_14249, partial [Atta colombica]